VEAATEAEVERKRRRGNVTGLAFLPHDGSMENIAYKINFHNLSKIITKLHSNKTEKILTFRR
jgi:hypothetical protein